MPTYVTANEKANNEFIIPVEWTVYDTVRVQANSLDEAYRYVEENINEIPLGDAPEYIDDSYKISSDDQEECILHQNTNKPICLEFNCSNTFVQGPDPLQFVNGKGVASAVFHYQENNLVIKLKACIDGYADNPGGFIYLYDQDQQLFDRPISEATIENILSDMTKIAEQYFTNK